MNIHRVDRGDEHRTFTCNDEDTELTARGGLPLSYLFART